MYSYSYLLYVKVIVLSHFKCTKMFALKPQKHFCILEISSSFTETFSSPSRWRLPVCSAACCCCQEAHAVSQFSFVSPLDHHPEPIHSLQRTRVPAQPPPYLSNSVVPKRADHLTTRCMPRSLRLQLRI